MNKYSEDKRVVFQENNHSYFLGKKKLISVTSFLNKFKNKFDSDFYSKKIALRDGKTQEEVLKEWKYKAFKSTEIGTAIHKIFEDYTYNNFVILNNELIFDYLELDSDFFIDFNNKKDISLKFINDFFLTKRLTPIKSELIVYNDFLAGQIDMICSDKKDNYYIIDFKTNEKIEKYSYNKKMLLEFNFLNDSNYYHYSLQLSIYKQLLKDYTINKLFIVHIMSDSYEFIECEDIFKKYNLSFIDLLNKK